MANLAVRLQRYCNRVYGLEQALRRINDGRRFPEHVLDGLLLKTLMGIITRTPSFNQLAEAVADGDFDRIGGSFRPCADTFSRAFEKLELDELKAVNDAIIKKARRNKALDDVKVEGYRVVAFDGTGCFSTESGRLGRESHCHEDEDGGSIYHEKALAASYVGGEGATVLLELARIPKGKGETTVGRKVLRRLFERHCRYCDFITVDAGFAGAPFLNEVLEQKKEFVVRVKQEDRNLVKDADGVFDGKAADEHHKDVRLRQERVRYDVEIWDEEGFITWEQMKQPVRCLRVRERRKEINAAGEVVSSNSFTTHLVTSASKKTAPALTIWKIAHMRWDVENTGFHFMKHHFELEHAYSYEPKVIEVMLRLFVIAFNLLMLFVHRNLKGFDRKRDTLLGVLRRIHKGLIILSERLRPPDMEPL